MKSKNAIALAALAAAFGSALPTSANAAIVLDQIVNWPAGSEISASGSRYIGQTFTAGVSGKLNNIRVYITTNHNDTPFDLNFKFAPIVGGQLLLSQAVNITLPSSAGTPAFAEFPVDQWTNLDYSTFNIAIHQGQQYAVLFNQSSGDIANSLAGWNISPQDTYAGGHYFATNQPGIDQALPGFDVNGFNPDMDFATYISAVPEPSTWAMLMLGFGAMGIMLRGRTRNPKELAI